MSNMAKDPEMQRWWKETSSCQILLPGSRPEEPWKPMEMLFFQE
jgi:L-rhamnose mutarotase